MSFDYLLFEDGITQISMQAVIKYLADIHNASEEDILGLIKKNTNKLGEHTGVKVRMPLKFDRGVIITVDGNPTCLTENHYRDRFEYFLVNPELRQNIEEEFKASLAE